MDVPEYHISSFELCYLRKLFMIMRSYTCFVSVSPYLKSLSMVAANKLLHLLEVSNFHVAFEFWYFPFSFFFALGPRFQIILHDKRHGRFCKFLDYIFDISSVK